MSKVKHFITHVFVTTLSVTAFLILWHVGSFRPGENDVPGRRGGWVQVSTHQDPCSVQFRHHTLRSATVGVGSGAHQSSGAPFVVLAFNISINGTKFKKMVVRCF